MRHAWDLARAVGGDFAPTDEPVRFTVDLGEQIPDGEERTPGFAPRVPVPDPAPDLDRMLALYGGAV